MVGHEAASPTVKVAARRRLIASGSRDHTIRLWNLDTGELQKVLRTPHLVASLTFARGNSLLVGTTADGTLDVWNPATGQLTASHSVWRPADNPKSLAIIR